MNTLKMKVLLILTNRQLWNSILQALLIWSTTAVAGCTFVYIIELINPPFTVWESYALSLVFSSPAILVAATVIYYLPSFSSVPKRITFGVGSILLVSAGIIGLVSIVFKVEYELVAITLLPFIPSAILGFFLFTGKQLSRTYLYHNSNNLTHI